MFKYLLLKCYYKSKNNDTSHDINNFYIDSEWTCPICYNEISNNLISFCNFIYFHRVSMNFFQFDVD